MGGGEAVVGLDGLKGEEGAARTSLSSLGASSDTTAQLEVKLPWYLGITRKVGPTVVCWAIKC